MDTRGEYHEIIAGVESDDTPAHRHGVYGLGPRVPMYALSPWSRGGWVNSQVFDHTSVLRFIEQRFGVAEPNISPWRRAVCGDLTSLFDFSASEPAVPGTTLPATAARAARAAALPGTATPTAPDQPPPARQQPGLRPSRALPYALHAHATARDHALTLRLDNPGAAGAVLHVYDRLHLERGPRRYTVEAGKRLDGIWDTATDDGRYDLWVLGPNGFHRHFAGRLAAGAQAAPDIQASYDAPGARLRLTLTNPGKRAVEFHIADAAYGQRAQTRRVAAGATSQCDWDVGRLGGWYDCAVTLTDTPAATFLRRLAGRLETGKPSTSDPAMGQELILDWNLPHETARPLRERRDLPVRRQPRTGRRAAGPGAVRRQDRHVRSDARLQRQGTGADGGPARRGAGRPGPPSLRDRDGQCGDPALRPGGRSLRGGGGEGPYEAWRDGHIAYFERNGGYRPDMLLACERFRVVEVFER